jgi:hypothetical protein
MQVTWENYKLVLPESLWQAFETMANNMFAKNDNRAIYYENSCLIKKVE